MLEFPYFRKPPYFASKELLEALRAARRLLHAHAGLLEGPLRAVSGLGVGR